MKTSYLKERAGMYYFRRVLPSDVCHLFPKKEICKALQTSDKRVASLLVRQHAADLDRVLLLIRSCRGLMPSDYIQQLIDYYLDYSVKRHDEKRTEKAATEPLDLDKRLKDAITTSERSKEQATFLGFQLTINTYDATVTVITDEIIKLANLDIKPKSAEYLDICRAVAKAQIVKEETLQQRAIGNYNNPYDKSSRERLVFPVSEAEDARSIKMLSAAVTDYINSLISDLEKTDFEEYNGPSKATISDEYRPALDLFIEWAGDITTDAVTYDLVKKYKDALATIPRNRTKSKILKGCKSLQDKINTAEKLKLPSIGVAQREKIFSTLKRFTTWASYKHRHYMPYDPAEGIKAPRAGKRAKSAVEKRKAFTDDDINNIVTGLVAEQEKDRHFQQYPERYWLPLIAIHSGLRAEEIAQLNSSDIKEQDGIAYFDANWFDDDGMPVKHLKTAASKRIVPVHSTLITLGFLDFVEQVRRAKQPRLWMNLNLSSKDFYRRKVTDWFNGTDRYVGFRKIYITDYDKKTFHSARHTVVDWYKQRNHEEQAVAELLGHQHPNITFDTYGNPLRTPVKAEYLELLKYDVDFVGKLGHWFKFSGTTPTWKPPKGQGKAVKRRSKQAAE